MTELNALEIIVIKHAKDTGCLSMTNNFGLSLESFTSACKSLQRRGLIDGTPISVDQTPGEIISFNLRKDALRLI